MNFLIYGRRMRHQSEILHKIFCCSGNCSASTNRRSIGATNSSWILFFSTVSKSHPWCRVLVNNSLFVHKSFILAKLFLKFTFMMEKRKSRYLSFALGRCFWLVPNPEKFTWDCHYFHLPRASTVLKIDNTEKWLRQGQMRDNELETSRGPLASLDSS